MNTAGFPDWLLEQSRRAFGSRSRPVDIQMVSVVPPVVPRENPGTHPYREAQFKQYGPQSIANNQTWVIVPDCYYDTLFVVQYQVGGAGDQLEIRVANEILSSAVEGLYNSLPVSPILAVTQWTGNGGLDADYTEREIELPLCNLPIGITGRAMGGGPYSVSATLLRRR